MVEVGDSAPDFTLVDQNRNEVTLSRFRGEKSVVLSWHIHSFTGRLNGPGLLVPGREPGLRGEECPGTGY